MGSNPGPRKRLIGPREGIKRKKITRYFFFKHHKLHPTNVIILSFGGFNTETRSLARRPHSVSLKILVQLHFATLSQVTIP